jgi:hypothetical protein
MRNFYRSQIADSVKIGNKEREMAEKEKILGRRKTEEMEDI